MRRVDDDDGFYDSDDFPMGGMIIFLVIAIFTIGILCIAIKGKEDERQPIARYSRPTIEPYGPENQASPVCKLSKTFSGI